MADPPTGQPDTTALVKRLREVYPIDRDKCAWCDNRYKSHHYDCPVPDIHALLSRLATVEQEFATFKADTADVLDAAATRFDTVEQERDRLETDSRQRQQEIAKLITEVLQERDKVEMMARRADRFLLRAEALEQQLDAKERQVLMAVRDEIQDDRSGLYGEPSGVQALRILDIRLRALPAPPPEADPHADAD